MDRDSRRVVNGQEAGVSWNMRLLGNQTERCIKDDDFDVCISD
jgi:hypothetical protein